MRRAAGAWSAARDRPEEGRRIAIEVIAACGAGDEEALVVALRTRGWAERVLCMYPESRDALNRAVRVARRSGLAERLSEALISRASLFLDLGRSGAALADIAAARDALGGGSTIELDAQEALVQMKFGQHARAVELGRRARSQITEATNPVTRVMVLTNLGEAFSHLGRLREADDAFAAAVAVAAGVGRLNLGMVIQTRAAAAVRGGRAAEGLALFDRAEALLAEAGWPLGEHYLERIESFAALRLVSEAEETVERATRHFQEAGLALLLAETRLRQSRLLLGSERSAEAEPPAVSAAGLFRRQRRVGYEAQADLVAIEARFRAGPASRTDLRRARRAAAVLAASGAHLEAVEADLLIGRIAGALGLRGEAMDSYARAGAGSRRGGSLLRLKGCLADALAARTRGDEASVRRAARRGLTEVARFRSSLPSTELRALASGHGVELAMMGLDSIRRTGRVDRVLEWMERGRLASILADPPRPQDAALDEAMARLREVMAEQRSAAEDADRLSRLRLEQDRLEARIQRRIRTLDPAGSESGAIASPAQVREALGDRSLLAFAAVDGQVVVAALGPAGRRVVEAGMGAPVLRQVEALHFGLRRVLRSRTPVSEEVARAGIAHSLEALDAQLVRPVLDLVGDEVVVVPTASLFAVPWHALPSLADRLVSVAPSATVWTRAMAGRPSAGEIVVAAGPGLDGAEAEAEAVGRLHPGAAVLVPPASTVGAVRAAVDGAALAHLACHGSFRADNPSFSSLELADGPLTVLDFEAMTRAPDLVVLASCDSGASLALPGDELRGFLSALFMLGTRSVVASAVPVPDVESTSLMTDLHGGLAAGLPPGEALARARARLDTTTASGLVLATAFGLFGAG